ncbi:SapC family protein, partial [Xanthomonas sp. Kuri4-1]
HGAQHRLAGFHTIDEDRLRALDADALWQLHQAGWLEPIYMVVASMSNFRALIERMNRRHAAGLRAADTGAPEVHAQDDGYRIDLPEGFLRCCTSTACARPRAAHCGCRPTACSTA